MDPWTILLHELILLAAALVLGTLAESLRQSAMIGYLLAGMLVGPHVLGWVPAGEEVEAISELGAALLLFSIGLEFSVSRLMRMKTLTLAGGSLQVLVTGVAGCCVALMLDTGPRVAIALGAIVALSSTACVVGVLMARVQLDSLYGRHALGILLFQDAAVVPLVLLVSALGAGAGFGATTWELAKTAGLAALLFGVLYFLLNYAVPRLLHLPTLTRNRQLPILLAMLIALGAAWGAHALGLSPSFGAFMAGLLLAESPFAVQIRADVRPIRDIMVTLFFAAVGLYGDPVWLVRHLPQVLAVVGLIVIGKPAVLLLVLRVIGTPWGLALATGVALAQIGEFSFVLTTIAASNGILSESVFRLIVSATFVSLILTPYLVRLAPGLVVRLEGLAGSGRGKLPKAAVEGDERFQAPETGRKPFTAIIGFGPAGQQTVQHLAAEDPSRLVVLDLNPRNLRAARELGIETHVGDASRLDVLEHLGLERAEAVVVTLPDPDMTRQVILLCKSFAPGVPIVARVRYHVSKWDLLSAGADAVVDEEEEMGQHLAQALRDQLDRSH